MNCLAISHSARAFSQSASSGLRLVTSDLTTARTSGLYNIYDDTGILRRLSLPLLQNEIHFILRSRLDSHPDRGARTKTREQKMLYERQRYVDFWNIFDCFDAANAAAYVYAISRLWGLPLSCFPPLIGQVFRRQCRIEGASKFAEFVVVCKVNRARVWEIFLAALCAPLLSLILTSSPPIVSAISHKNLAYLAK